MRAAVWTFAIALVPVAAGAAPTYVENPYARKATGPVAIDVQAGTVGGRRVPLVDVPNHGISFGDLDAHKGDSPPGPADDFRAALPAGFAQRGDTIVPEEVLDGALMVGDLSLVDAPRELEGGQADACAYPDEVPPGIYPEPTRRGDEYPRRGTIYLNFVGATLESGSENSAENYSTIARTGHPYPAFTGGVAKAVAVAQAVAQDFDRWAIRVVYDPRPRKILPYTMAMVGGNYTDTTSGPAGGVAPIDCEDYGQRNVCYSFTNEQPAISQANIVSQEVAHTYGLEHTYGADRIMSYEGGGDKIFGSNCQQTFAVAGQGNGCQGVNKCHCGIGDLQDDSLTIGIIYAPFDVPDVTPPEVELTAPADGSVYQVGEEIIVDFEVGDDFGGYGWKLVIEDEAGETLVDQADYDRALQFSIVGLPPGTYTFTGEIEDHADHITTHSITVIVEGEAGTTSGGVADTSGSSGGGSADSTGAVSDGDGGGSSDGGTGSGSGSGSGGANTDEGCACSTRTARVPWWMLAIVPIVSRRRRGAGRHFGTRSSSPARVQ